LPFAGAGGTAAGVLADRILFIDAEALVVNKPAGLAVDRPRDNAPSVAAAVDSLRFGFARPPGLVHRLDRDTSGALLLARNPRAHRRFAAAFDQGLVEKRYLAVLDGVPDAKRGTVDLPLAKVSTREAGWRVVADPRGKPARTGWQVLGEADGRALVRLQPESGRTHQLRVHMSAGLGLPIAGDPVYGRVGGAMLLHAWRLRVPREGKPPVEGEAPLPSHFDRWRALVEADVDAAA
jgi:tRNA pseudouridine32 synthase / 23S rRNA pseudouridine746 synthase